MVVLAGDETMVSGFLTGRHSNLSMRVPEGVAEVKKTSQTISAGVMLPSILPTPFWPG